MEGTGQSTLRAKYLDWCSARLAERFLDLSAEEIYALAQPDEGGEASVAAEAPEVPGEVGQAGSSSEDSRPASSPPTGPPSGVSDSKHRRLPRPTDEGYRVLVQRVTEALLQRTSLPTFEQWSDAYSETPDRFDAELLGLWKDVVDGEAEEEAEVPPE